MVSNRSQDSLNTGPSPSEPLISVRNFGPSKRPMAKPQSGKDAELPNFLNPNFFHPRSRGGRAEAGNVCTDICEWACAMLPTGSWGLGLSEAVLPSSCTMGVMFQVSSYEFRLVSDGRSGEQWQLQTCRKRNATWLPVPRSDTSNDIGEEDTTDDITSGLKLKP